MLAVICYYVDNMELFYNLCFSLALFTLVWGGVGLIAPNLYTKLLKQHANRKTIILLTVGLFLSFGLLGAIFEPESVKQKRTQEQHATQLASQQEVQTKEHPVPVEETAPAEEQFVDEAPIDPRYYWHEVVRVVDGDTLVARVDGKEEKIRVIGIDTPESTTKSECFGKAAAAKAKEFLTGKWIQLESDETQGDRDKYSRLLRYVWFDEGTDFGRRLIEEGYAYEYTYSNVYDKQAQYKETETYAKQQSNGLWSKDTCAGKIQKQTKTIATAPKPKPQSTTPAYTTPKPAPKPSSNSGGVVKKSVNNICHAPGTTYYSRTTNYTVYNSLQACLNSGGRLPLR